MCFAGYISGKRYAERWINMKKAKIVLIFSLLVLISLLVVFIVTRPTEENEAEPKPVSKLEQYQAGLKDK